MKSRWLGVVAGVLMASSAWAADEKLALGDRNQPVEIAADSLEVLQANEKAIFRGNVEVHQGAVMMTAATMTVYYKQQSDKAAAAGAAGAVSRIEADGGVHLSTAQETARGHKGVYDVDGRKVTLVGDVLLTRGKNILKGEKLTYDLDSGQSVLGAGAATNADGTVKQGGGRVKALFVPDAKK